VPPHIPSQDRDPEPELPVGACLQGESGDAEPASTKVLEPRKHLGSGAFVGTIATNLALQGCMVVQGIILARMLGPEGRGIYTAAVLWPTMFAFIGFFGIHRVIGRIAAKEHDLGPITRTAFILAVCVSGLTVGLGALLLPFLLPADKIAVVLPLAFLALALVPLRQITISLQAVWQGAGNFKRVNICRALMNPTFVAILIVLWLIGNQQVSYVVMAFILAMGTMAAAFIVTSFRSVGLSRHIYPPGRILANCWQFGLASIGFEMYQRIDQALLLWLLNDQIEALGFYIVAFSAASVVGDFMVAIGLVGFTKTAQAPPRQGFAQVANMLRKATVLWVLGGAALAVAMPTLLPLIFGSDFAPSVPIAICLIIGLGMFGLTNILNQCMFGQGRPFAGLTSRTIAMAVMVVAGYGLVRSHGTIGMAIAYDIAQIACISGMLVFVCRHYEDSKASLLIPRLSDVVELAALIRKTAGKLFSHE